MFELKEKEYTMNTFMKALKRVGEDLSYVGTYYESPMIDKQIIATPTLKVEREDDIYIVDITLKPNVGEETEQIEDLGYYINLLNMGFTNFKNDPLKKKNRHQTAMGKFLAQNSVTSEIQDYDLSIVMGKPKVTRMDTVINGVPYQKYTLEEEYDFGEGVVYKHKIHSLFKEKTSDGENFFSALVDKDLDKRDTNKVLESLSERNITGLFIGGYKSNPDVPDHLKTTTIYYGTLGNARIDKVDKGYYVGITNGGTLIPHESLSGSKVKRVGDNRYTMELYSSRTTTELFIG